MALPHFEEIRSAYSRIRDYIQNTPVITCGSIDRITGSRIYFKCENFQKAGAFKSRGALNAVLQLTDQQKTCGVATHSSGNHAAALARAAALIGVKAYIVMPENAPEIKKKAVSGYGGEITFCKPALEDREKTLKAVIQNTGATFIHPYDNPEVISGQGTAAMELLLEMPEPEIILAPVGGGGLLSGTSITVRALSPRTGIYGAEPELADDAFESLKTGTLQPPKPPRSIADGLLTSLSERTFSIIRKNVNGIFRVSEENIIKAMRLLWERAKIIVEPSASVPLAAILQYPESFHHKTVGIILSGGNVDLDHLPFHAIQS